ncbi:MAG: FapA family protein [Planctomycetota bacterium]|nr:FapA family protein [Planctomycetota bacterium]
MTERANTPVPSVIVCAERLSARIVLPVGLDAEAASELSLRAVAKERGVHLTAEAVTLLAEIAERYANGESPIDQEFLRATLPVNGVDAWIEWMDGFNPSEMNDSPEADQSGTIDYYNRQSFIRVSKNEPIATLHAHTEGEDGLDVCGGTLTATAGKRLGMTIDKSLVLSDDRQLVAQIDGVLKLCKGKLRVEPVLEIAGAVDFSTGNIDFDGDVMIREDIRDHFRVRATKDVTIEGLIDASHITCGGNLYARRGVAGRDEGTLDIGGDAEIGYIEQARGKIEGSLSILREIMHSTLEIGKDLTGDAGRVIGGSLHVLGDVRLAEIGSRGDTPTKLILGPKSELTDEGEAAANTHVLNEIEKMRNELRVLQDPTTPRSAVNAERMTELEFEIAEAEAELQALPTNVETPVDAECTSTIEVLRMIHARVTLEISGRTIVFGHELKGPVKIWLEGDTVMHQLGNAEPAPLRGTAGVQDRLAA